MVENFHARTLGGSKFSSGATCLRVFIPGLIPVDTMREPLLTDMHLPALSTLLSKGSCTYEMESADLYHVLYGQLGLLRQQDWPVAPVAAEQDGLLAESYYWLCADPVHLRAARDQIMLVDASAFEVAMEEAEQYITAFNTHFADSGYTLFAPHPKRWYLRGANTPHIETYPLHQVSGQTVNKKIPRGNDALVWHRMANEIQMLFFNLPINETRQDQDKLPINGVWFWGGGRLTQPASHKCDFLWSDNFYLQSCAAHSGVPYAGVPDHGSECQMGWVVLDALQASAQYADYATWREELMQLEQAFFLPWLTQIKRGTLSYLELWSQVGEQVVCWHVYRKDLLRFWRQNTLIKSMGAL